MKKKFLSAGLISIALVGCSTPNTGSNNTVTSESTSTSLQPTQTSEGNTFVYPLVGGGTFDLSRGDNAQPIALWFWAPG